MISDVKKENKPVKRLVFNWILICSWVPYILRFQFYISTLYLNQWCFSHGYEEDQHEQGADRSRWYTLAKAGHMCIYIYIYVHLAGWKDITEWIIFFKKWLKYYLTDRIAPNGHNYGRFCPFFKFYFGHLNSFAALPFLQFWHPLSFTLMSTGLEAATSLASPSLAIHSYS